MSWKNPKTKPDFFLNCFLNSFHYKIKIRREKILVYLQFTKTITEMIFNMDNEDTNIFQNSSINNFKKLKQDFTV